MLVAAIVVLGVLVVGSTAASYDGAEAVSVGGGDGGDAAGSGSGSALPTSGQSGSAQGIPLPSWIVENFVLLTVGLGTALVVVGTVVITWLKGLDGLQRVLSLLGQTMAGGVLYLVVVGFLAWLVFGFNGEGIELATSQAAESASGASAAGGGEDAGGSAGRSVPYWWLLVAFWVLLGVGWFYLVNRRRLDDDTSDVGGSGGSLPEGSFEHDEAVSAQETVSDVPASNPVYSAWREMATEAAESASGTLTANEVAAAADDRGLDDDAVRTLTRLFEEVRYGGRPVTEDRKRRARSALESIDGSGGRGA